LSDLRIVPLILTLLIIITSSCNFVGGSNGNAIEFDTLRPPKDSLTVYFKAKSNEQDKTADGLSDFANRWYSQMLFALKEPVLKDYKGSKEIYRFTWLRTFNHPISIRLECQDGNVLLFSKVCDGKGGYQPGKIMFDKYLTLTTGAIDICRKKVEEAAFWSQPTEIKSEGLDGSEWIIEAVKNGKYHMVVRWSPDEDQSEKFRAIGKYLISLSRIENETAGDNYY